MDVYESQRIVRRIKEVDTRKKPSIPVEKTFDGLPSTPHRSRTTRDASPRHFSPAPAPSAASRRCSSPSFARPTISAATQFAVSKRAVSAERKRPTTPTTTPSRPATPVHDTSVETPLPSKKITGSRLPEALWPSTMRSLSVSFQSDSISIPVPKKEKPVTHALSDRTLKPSSNVASKQTDVAGLTRKSTPERKRTPLKGKNSSDQTENSRPPPDGAQARLIDHHRWPSRSGGKLSLNIATRSMDLGDRTGRSSNSSLSSPVVSSLRRLSSEGIPRPFQKTTNDDASTGQSPTDDRGKNLVQMKAVDDIIFRTSMRHNLNSPRSPENKMLANNSPKAQPLPGSRMPSPSRINVPKVTPSPLRTRPSTPSSARGASPSRIWPSTPNSARGPSPSRVWPSTPSSARGVSPSQIWPSSPTSQTSPTGTSVLSFVADIRKGKKAANQLEDAHNLRLLYNRYLQWRYTNAQADAALHVQKVAAEEMLYNVWRATLELWDSVIMKRVELQQSKQDVKVIMLLDKQLAVLEDWALLQREHSASVAGAIKDLESSTLRLPVTGGAKVDIESLKSAISSAVEVMHAMTCSICSVLPKAEDTSGLVSEVAELAAEERAMLDECEALTTSSAAMQVEEYSLRAQLIQQLQGPRNERGHFGLCKKDKTMLSEWSSETYSLKC